MTATYYVCKYTPVELLTALGADCRLLDTMTDDLSRAEEVTSPNLCGFGKTVLETVLAGDVRELVLVSCCDSIKSVWDILAATGKLDFLYLLDIGHCENACGRDHLAGQLLDLAQAYAEYKGTSFDVDRFRAAFAPPAPQPGPHLAVAGARMGGPLFRAVAAVLPLPVVNETCVNNRSVAAADMPRTDDLTALMDWYAGVLLNQLPCMRMQDNTGRRRLYEDPDLRGIIYHTVKFCDFYGFEYAEIKNHTNLPLVKIETDYTLQSSGQLLTRLEAFAEGLTMAQAPERKHTTVTKGYFAGIDSGSTSTDVVILDQDKNIKAQVILPTGAGAAQGADRALAAALQEAGLARSDILEVVATGYGRTAIQAGDRSITEITCHARGAHFLNPQVRTVVDIGGQDSKVIRLNEDGSVKNFVMNDKCAAGTGRFLEMMARTLEMSLDQLSAAGLDWQEDITISSMCTVFAESEVVSLVARNKATPDIIHGLDKAVASKTASLARRVDGTAPYMMTGGVAQNKGVVKALEEKLGAPLIIDDKAQLCGALGAALFAMDAAAEA